MILVIKLLKSIRDIFMEIMTQVDKKELTKTLTSMKASLNSSPRNNTGISPIELKDLDCLIISGWVDNLEDLLFTISLLFGIERNTAKNYILMDLLTETVQHCSMITAPSLTRMQEVTQKSQCMRYSLITQICSGLEILDKT